MLFQGNYYYPYGGWGDFSGDFDTMEEAIESIQPMSDWAEIVDIKTKKLTKYIAATMKGALFKQKG